MPTYRCWDESGTQVDIEADNAKEACREYVDGGSWDADDKTTWVSVQAERLDEEGEETGDVESHDIEIEPTEPWCVDRDTDHDWRRPIGLVGGIAENPGCQGHGGGVVITEVCVCCGCKKTTDSWAQNPSNGRQGLTSVEYEPRAFDLDAESMDYVVEAGNLKMDLHGTWSEIEDEAREQIAEWKDEGAVEEGDPVTYSRYGVVVHEADVE